MRDQKRYWAAAALLGLAGVAVRAWAIGSEPLWLDEAYSAYAADHDFTFLWHVVPRYETHPPFYYSLLHLWVGLFGNGLFALRLPGLLAGFATPPVAALAASEVAAWLGWRDARRSRLCLVSFGLASLSMALVEMSRQVRPYPIMVFVFAAAILVMLRLGRQRDEGRPLALGEYATYLLLVEAMLWLHSLGPLFGLSLVIAFAVAMSRPFPTPGAWPWLIGGHALLALCYLPGLIILHDQAPTWVASTWLRFSLDRGFVDHIATLYAAPDLAGLGGVLLAGLALAALKRTRIGIRLAVILLTLALLPVILSVAISLTITPVFITRTMTPVVVPAILLLAIGAAAWDGKGRILGLGGASMIGAALFTADLQARLSGPTQNWYPALAWLAPKFQPGDQIFAYPNEGALPLHYALRDKGLAYPIRAIPTAVPTFDVMGGRYPTGSRGVVSLPRAELRAIAEEPATRAVPTIWLLRLGAPTYDPGDAFLQELHRGRYVVRSWDDGPINIIGLRLLSKAPKSQPGPVRNRQ
ncbi:MAG TPA: hypothetical protein VNT42_05730 [Sphingomonas sp.]|nr:hypothetical protein [Sphingomonas sp.]